MDIAGFMVPIMTSVQPGWPKFASFDFSHLSGHEIGRKDVTKTSRWRRKDML